MSHSAFALGPDKCSEKGVSLVGLYGEKGEYDSPILKMWSEESGNLFSIMVKAKEPFSKVALNFKNDKSNVIESQTFKLIKNKASKIDLAHILTELKERPRILEIRIFNKDGIYFCHEEQKIIERDEQDGVLKNAK